LANCRTENRPMSFFGVDLGVGRQLLPSCYTIRNRNVDTYVMVNWRFEGSNDNDHWVTLDHRHYQTGDPLIDANFIEERKLLCKKGGFSTWSIDPSIYHQIGLNGF